MRLAVAVALYLLAQAPAEDTPGKRAAIAGLAGFTATSTIVFASEPDVPHVLETTYVFPDRVRWVLVKESGRTDERRHFFRSGSRVFELAPGKTASEQHSGPALLDYLRRMELRRAAMFFPDGFDWKKTAEVRRADLGELGHLEALIEKGEPRSIASFDAQGKLRETFAELEWTKHDGRAWPASFRLVAAEAGGVVWSETVRSVDTKQRFVDAFFLPPDRRDLASPAEIGGRKVRYKDLGRLAFRRERLPANTDWPAIFELCSAKWAEWSKDLEARGLALSDMPAVEVSDAGRPKALLLFLDATPRGTLPARFQVGTAVGAFTLFLPEGPAQVSAGLVSQIRKAVPGDHGAGTPYVLVDRTKDATAGAQLVVPLEPGS